MRRQEYVFFQRWRIPQRLQIASCLILFFCIGLLIRGIFDVTRGDTTYGNDLQAMVLTLWVMLALRQLMMANQGIFIPLMQNLQEEINLWQHNDEVRPLFAP